MAKDNIDVIINGSVSELSQTNKTVVLKNNKSFIEQITDSNTTYVIRWDFDLSNQEVIIPNDCVLLFNGGSLNNGTLVGNNTKIDADKVGIFTGITIFGTWDITDIYSCWFNDITSENMLRQLVNLTSDNPNNVYIDDGEYLVSVDTPNGKALQFSHSNINIYNSGTIKLKPNSYWGYYIIQLSGNNITLNGGEFIGDAKDHDYSTYQGTNRATHEWGRGVVTSGNNNNILNVKSSLCTGDAFNVGGKNITLNNIIAEKSRRQGITAGTSVNLIISNFSISNIGDFDVDGVHITRTAPSAGIDVEPTASRDVAQNVLIKNGIITDSHRGILLDRTIADSHNENMVIENVIIDNVNIAYKVYRVDRVLFNNIRITNVSTAFDFYNLEYLMPITINNMYCLLRTDDGSTLFETTRFCRFIINNSDLTGHILVNSDSVGESSSFVFNNCNIVNDNPINKGTYWFNGCTISNNAELGFASSRPLSVTVGNRPVNLYLKDCTIKSEGSQTYTVRLDGSSQSNQVYMRAENCTFIDDKVDTQYIVRVVDNAYVELIDCKFQSASSSPIYIYDTSDKAVEKYITLYQSGATEDRPTQLTKFARGHRYFDTTLGKPIYWKGTTWVDATGATV